MPLAFSMDSAPFQKRLQILAKIVHWFDSQYDTHFDDDF